MMREVLKELASVFRAECANSGGPVQASLARMADMLDAKAATYSTWSEPGKVPPPGTLYAVGDEPRADADVAIVSISDDLEIED